MAGNNAIDYYVQTTLNLPTLSSGPTFPVQESKCMHVNLSLFQTRNDSKDLMTSHTSTVLVNVVRMVFVPLLFLVGFPSNIINMVVFYKHGLKQRINLCLFCLSLADLVLVTMAFLMYVEKLQHVDFEVSNFGRVSAVLINNRMLWLYSGSSVVSQFISTVIAGDRCLCVTRPLQSISLLTTKHLGILLLVGVILILAGRFVPAQKLLMICLVDSMTGRTFYQLTVSEFYRKNQKRMDILEGTVHGLGLPVIFCILVIVSTVIMAVHLQKSTDFHKESSSVSSKSSSSSRNVGVTRMLIYLSIQFLVLNMPVVIPRVAIIFLPQLSTTGQWANLYFFTLAFCELCAVINSSLNFLIYYLCGTKYRVTVLEMTQRISWS